MTEDPQRRYLLLLPASEGEWARLPESEHELGLQNHQRFHEELAARGHTLVMANPLEPTGKPSRCATLAEDRPSSPMARFIETTEQIVRST